MTSQNLMASTKWLLLIGLLYVPSSNAERNIFKDLYDRDFSSKEVKLGATLDGELGMQLSTGNTDTSTLKASLNSLHETEHFSNRYHVEALFQQHEVESDDGDTRSETAAQRWFSTVEVDYKLDESNKRLFFYGDYENDRFNGYDYRATLASGWSHKMSNASYGDFRYSFGPGYTFLSLEEENDSDVDNGMVIRASAEYRYQWASGAKLRQHISTEAGKSNTRSRSETSVTATIVDELGMKFSVVLHHESNPSIDASALSTETAFTLVYRFF